MEPGMTKQDKALRKMRNNLKQVRFNDLAKVLEEYGFKRRKTGGSHQVFARTISHHRPFSKSTPA
jgi:virulence-associated protein VapD